MGSLQPQVFCILIIATIALAAGKQPPNIVLIVADDLGWNDVSFHGSNQIPTPNIDALAYDGIILNNYYVQPVCTPTRSALLTGRYPIHTGLQHNVIVGSAPFGLGLDEKLLPEYLRDLGYANHIVGKWHLGFFKKEYTPIYRGFDSHFGYYQGCEDYYKHTYWVHYPNPKTNGFDFRRNMTLDQADTGKYSTELYTQEAERLIAKHNKSQPLFLYLPQQAVHSASPDDPLQAPQKYIDKFSHIKNEKRRKFAAMVSALDDSVGNVTKALARAGMLNNTVIMFTTDNGGPVNGFDMNAASNWPLRGCKATLWEGGTRATGFVWSPLLEKSRYVSPHMMHVVDWFPTLLRIAGHDMSILPRDHVDGMDMWHVLSTNQESSPRTDILYNIDPMLNNSALRVENLKIIQGFGGDYSGWYPPWQAPEDGEEDQKQGERRKIQSNEKSQGDQNTLKYQKIKREHQEFSGSSTKFQSDLPRLFSKVLGRMPAKPTPVVVDCGSRPANASTNCHPVEAPCLFDLDQDPCEFNNLAAGRPEQVKELLGRLKLYEATAVPPRYKHEDPKGLPYYHNGNWVPWVK